MKRLLLVIGALLFIVGCGQEDVAIEVEDDLEVSQENEEESFDEKIDEEEVTWDDMKEKDKVIGKSDKDFSDLSDSKPTDVRNDTTGNWRKSTIAESVDIEDYALSYYDLHMEEDEVHHIINFTRNTTTWLNQIGGLLYVDIKEYVKKEEHDAKKLGSGMLLKSYVIYPDGDIQTLEY